MSHATGSPSPDAKHAAISGRQVAIIGAIAGLLSAAVAIPTTLISAEKAGETAIETVNTQLAGETARSRAEFLRGQKQVLDAKVLEHWRFLVIAWRRRDDGWEAYVAAARDGSVLIAGEQASRLHTVIDGGWQLRLLVGNGASAGMTPRRKDNNQRHRPKAPCPRKSGCGVWHTWSARSIVCNLYHVPITTPVTTCAESNKRARTSRRSSTLLASAAARTRAKRAPAGAS